MEQVSCALSHAGSDVRCAVCGQGFLVFWSRLSLAEQNDCRRAIQKQLRDHHVASRDTHADRRIHPRDNFTIQMCGGVAEFTVSDKNIMEEVA